MDRPVQILPKQIPRRETRKTHIGMTTIPKIYRFILNAWNDLTNRLKNEQISKKF